MTLDRARAAPAPSHSDVGSPSPHSSSEEWRRRGRSNGAAIQRQPHGSHRRRSESGTVWSCTGQRRRGDELSRTIPHTYRSRHPRGEGNVHGDAWTSVAALPFGRGPTSPPVEPSLPSAAARSLRFQSVHSSAHSSAIAGVDHSTDLPTPPLLSLLRSTPSRLSRMLLRLPQSRFIGQPTTRCRA